jgi:hypothetical protein
VGEVLYRTEERRLQGQRGPAMPWCERDGRGLSWILHTVSNG